MPMKRQQFLKTLGLGIIAVPLAAQCNSDDPAPGSSDCVVTASETAGPFPTKDPSSLVMENIKSDRSGVPLSMVLTVNGTGNNCSPLQGLSVDVWHCDKEGHYSEYGGTGMQSANYTSVHFLRGRQTTSSDGQVGFSTIFPGWYSGRAPHIHVHVFDATGKSLLVTQIAFPKEICDTVYTTSPLYSSRGKQDTTNETDNVFRDGFDTEMAELQGSPDSGYALTHTINVNA